jgi:hypothetical protein
MAHRVAAALILATLVACGHAPSATAPRATAPPSTASAATVSPTTASATTPSLAPARLQRLADRALRAWMADRTGRKPTALLKRARDRIEGCALRWWGGLFGSDVLRLAALRALTIREGLEAGTYAEAHEEPAPGLILSVVVACA